MLLHSLLFIMSLTNGRTAEFVYITQDLPWIVHHQPLYTYTRK